MPPYSCSKKKKKKKKISDALQKKLRKNNISKFKEVH
jgi:hypothetical protein